MDNLGLIAICQSTSQANATPADKAMAATAGSAARVCKSAAPAAKPIIAIRIATPPVRVLAFDRLFLRPPQRYYASQVGWLMQLPQLLTAIKEKPAFQTLAPPPLALRWHSMAQASLSFDGSTIIG